MATHRDSGICVLYFYILTRFLFYWVVNEELINVKHKHMFPPGSIQYWFYYLCSYCMSTLYWFQAYNTCCYLYRLLCTHRAQGQQLIDILICTYNNNSVIIIPSFIIMTKKMFDFILAKKSRIFPHRIFSVEMLNSFSSLWHHIVTKELLR